MSCLIQLVVVANELSLAIALLLYMGEKKGLQILLSYSQAGPGRKAKQVQEEISRNHVHTFFLGSVLELPRKSR